MSCPSSIRHWGSNPRPSDEFPPITTRPGLPPKNVYTICTTRRCEAYFLTHKHSIEIYQLTDGMLVKTIKLSDEIGKVESTKIFGDRIAIQGPIP